MSGKHTEEGKKNISIARKKWLAENADKHPWKSNDKFRSIPCETLKETLRQHGVSFVEEYRPLSDRFYSLDVAFPQDRVAIEVNGNQHYDNAGKLKKYYQERHDLIEQAGWKLYEVHYSFVYNKQFVNDLINAIKTKIELIDYTYFPRQRKKKQVCQICNKIHHCHGQEICRSCRSKQRPKIVRKKRIFIPKVQRYCKDCGEKISKISIRCRRCASIVNQFHRRKVERPSLEILLHDVNNLGYLGTGKKYGVSDNAIRKWIKFLAVR